MNENLRLLRPFFRGLPIIIVVVIVAVIGAKKYLSYVTPIYESTAKLRLADVQEGVPSTNLFKDFDYFASANKIATEIEVLKSKELIEKTLATLPFHIEIYRIGEMRSVELYNDAPFKVEGTFHAPQLYDKPMQLQVQNNHSFVLTVPGYPSYKGIFGKPIRLETGQIILYLNQAYLRQKRDVKIKDRYSIEFLSTQKLIEKINKDLDIVPVDKDVPVIRINLKSNVPEKAALFVNALAQMYIQDYIENKYRAAHITTDFLQQEIAGANQKLKQSEDNIQQYRDQKNIINIRQETETDLRKISQLKIQQTNIKMNLDAIRDLNRYIDSGKKNYLDLAVNFEAFTDLLSTEMVKNMKKLQAEKKDLLLTYTSNHEKVKIIDDKINDLIAYQIESIKNTEKNLQIKYDDLSNDIAEAEKVFIGLPEKERIMNILDREFNLYEKNYNFLNEKRIEAEIAKSAKIAFHKIITPAEISKSPVSPIRIIIIIVAALLGFLGSTILIYLVHFTKAKVNDAVTLEKNSSIPIALATPFLRTDHEITQNALKEVIQLELKGIVFPHGILAITGYDLTLDHRFHAQQWYTAMCQQGRRVLVIDAIGDFSALVPQADYMDYSDPRFMEYTMADFEKALKSKKADYDVVLLYNQAICHYKLALLFMRMADQNIMVVDSRKTAAQAIVKIELLREEYQIPNLWFVLNRSAYNPSIFRVVRKFWQKKIQKK
ncbi:GNVR domain-containing protein [Flavobacterium sp.]|jgi:uncharacterized protein involved in exopolysaccharide biosynthesis|uniref:GNVR domain-containing protein n=1 Tax=Flavobacterium sp. TaxID=239 RepID=UPI0022C678CD|nr:GNVR domain-containing protein [Flavobacterium sp.]MCZ8145287.1 Wzz/FepE/Etk N-terminal domain-containing protein [Flavobacterium sp.]MCZ8366826.1 Wzz/FepE/Etk N-terminal domain-containing protein [Flavobacterium sp.]